MFLFDELLLLMISINKPLIYSLVLSLSLIHKFDLCTSLISLESIALAEIFLLKITDARESTSWENRYSGFIVRTKRIA